jgi:hypothetical protein
MSSSLTVSPLQAFRAREERLAAKTALLAELESYLADVRAKDRTPRECLSYDHV